MNFRRISARAAVAGVTTALAAGALVGITTTAADAATGTALYNCTNPYTADVIPLVTSVSADLSGLPPLPTGFTAPEGSLPVNVTFTVPAEVIAGLKANGFTELGAAGGDVNLPFGNVKVPLSGVAVDKAPFPESGDMTLSADATNGSFKLPNPGSQAVKMPASFLVTATNNVIDLPLTCAIDGEQPTITSLTVIKQDPSVVGKAPTKVKKGTAFNIKVTVMGNKPGTGKVVAKDGSKKIGTGTLKAGKTTIKITNGLSKVGTHNITLSYAGDKSSNPAQGGVLIKVTK